MTAPRDITEHASYIMGYLDMLKPEVRLAVWESVMGQIWQPIESAPRAGMRLLISDAQGRVFIGGYDPYWTGQTWVAENPRIAPGYEPRAWQPIPSPAKDTP